MDRKLFENRGMVETKINDIFPQDKFRDGLLEYMRRIDLDTPGLTIFSFPFRILLYDHCLVNRLSNARQSVHSTDNFKARYELTVNDEAEVFKVALSLDRTRLSAIRLYRQKVLLGTIPEDAIKNPKSFNGFNNLFTFLRLERASEYEEMFDVDKFKQTRKILLHTKNEMLAFDFLSPYMMRDSYLLGVNFVGGQVKFSIEGRVSG